MTPDPFFGRTWSPEEVHDQTGRTVLVTGVSRGGLGHHTALVLASRGARVLLAGRNPARISETAGLLRSAVPGADLGEVVVDLADLSSVRRAAASVVEPLHVLVNNAGVMGPAYTRTVDGFELQMATNHFGPFLLTGLLLPRLVEGGNARVVTVSSLMHRIAPRAPLGNPRIRHGRYLRWAEYGQSKLANLLFTHELERRLRAHALPVRALAAHPGVAGTHLAANGRFGRASGGPATILDAAARAVGQSAHDGALPTVMAATADLPGGTYCGPSGFRELRGAPRVVGCSRASRDPEAQRRLWELSEEAVGLRWP